MILMVSEKSQWQLWFRGRLKEQKSFRESTLNPRKVWRHDSFPTLPRLNLKSGLKRNFVTLKLQKTKRKNLTCQWSCCHGNRLRKNHARQSHDRTQTKANKFRQHKTCRLSRRPIARAQSQRESMFCSERWHRVGKFSCCGHQHLNGDWFWHQKAEWTRRTSEHAHGAIVAPFQWENQILLKSTHTLSRQTRAHFRAKDSRTSKH